MISMKEAIKRTEDVLGIKLENIVIGVIAFIIGLGVRNSIISIF